MLAVCPCIRHPMTNVKAIDTMPMFSFHLKLAPIATAIAIRQAISIAELLKLEFSYPVSVDE